MPKQKTHSGAKKRFKLTGTGKITRRRAMRDHHLEGKSKKVKRDFDKAIPLHKSQVPAVKKLLGKG
jgi:large subunit ribosomal protein L35